jgi:hypothetical protein
MERSKMKKVLCPVEAKNGKTYWMRIGTGFDNKDGSMNVYLDAYPANGKLQIREYDDDYKPKNNRIEQAGQASDALPF